MVHIELEIPLDPSDLADVQKNRKYGEETRRGHGWRLDVTSSLAGNGSMGPSP